MIGYVSSSTHQTEGEFCSSVERRGKIGDRGKSKSGNRREGISERENSNERVSSRGY